MARLNDASLQIIGDPVGKPAYDRANLVLGIVHIGVGAFHRAHMASYIDRLLASEPHWAIIGASLRRPDTKEALEPQDYLYSLTERGDDGNRTRIIGALLDIIDASESSQALIDQIARPNTQIVSLTVTEKGYCHEPSSGGLRLNHPDIMYDLAHLRTPRSVPGILVAALAERRARGHGGVTVLSCDNLQGNGKITRQAVLDFAQLNDPSLADWIDDTSCFPNTMIDRIVPATSDDDRVWAESVLGHEDAWPVVTEPFSQWVVEDRFAAGRPALESVGVEIVDDVEPFELMKLRLLNGSHSAIAYLGLLMGKTYVAEVVSDTHMRQFLRRLMLEEAAPTLTLPRDAMIDYADRLLARFGNSKLKHQCRQIAADGSQKLPQRVLVPARQRLAQGQSVDRMAVTVAAWIRYLEVNRAAGQRVADPMVDALYAAIGAADGSARSSVEAILGIASISGRDDGVMDNLISSVARQLERLRSDGPLAAIKASIA